jgi:hypothetical protein
MKRTGEIPPVLFSSFYNKQVDRKTKYTTAMKHIVILIIGFAFLIQYNIKSQNAPVSAVGAIFSYETTATVTIKATGFTNIGSTNQQLLYNPAVAVCTGVTKGSGLPGGLDYNISTPGVITFGWYTWPGATLPDNSVIFNLNFTRITYGSSVIDWNDNYFDRQWSDGNSFTLNDLPLSSYYYNGSVTFLTSNAPVTTAPIIQAMPSTTISVPITVNSFTNIGSLALAMQYSAPVLSYQSFTNDSGFPGLSIDGSTPGTITASGLAPAGGTGFTLPGNATLFTLNFLYNGGTTGLAWSDNGTSCQYTGYPTYNILNDSPTSTYYINGSVTEGGIRLGLKAFLEGAFENTEMTTHLKDLNLIPLSQPYNTSPWNYEGLETVATIPADVVDWVLIDLRETTGDATTATADKSIAKRAAFILKDGSIKDIDGTNNLEFDVSVTSNLFVVIYHRNHLAIISANPLGIFNGMSNYNFTTGEFQALGGSAGHKQLTTGIWGMMAGNANGDGIINDADKQNYWNPNAGTRGYISSDFSMDSQIDNKDKNDYWYLNVGNESQVP